MIVSPCESTPYAIKTDVKRRDSFWIKSQPYSLQDMLAGDPSVDAFVGGTVYPGVPERGLLSPLAQPRQRGHPPCDVVEGTYFSEMDAAGQDPEGGTESQAYMAHVAARAVFVIEADDPDIGLVAFVAVGMAEVSSCILEPGLVPGTHVEKGDELGRFQFGGSTFCLVFGPGVIADFTLEAIPRADHPDARVPVNSRLATAH